MKRLGLIACLCLISAMSFAEAEVTKRMDVSVFRSTAKFDMNADYLTYLDESIRDYLMGMKRFQVMGYQYQVSADSVEEFVTKLRDQKKASVLKDEKLVDPQFGVVMIPATEMEKLVNSVFIFIPVVKNYKIVQGILTNYVTDSKTKKVSIKSIVPTWQASVAVEIHIINSKGELLEIYRSQNASGEVTNEAMVPGAITKVALRGTLSGLEGFLRNQDEFKLKSVVLKRDSSFIFMQLGKDLGILPGYEFVMKQALTFGDKTVYQSGGLVRVSDVFDEYAIAQIVLGSPQLNDQLIEAPMAGLRSTLRVGVNLVQTPITSITFKQTSGSSLYSKAISQTPTTIDVGIDFTGEAGYNGLVILGGGVLINSPLGFYAHIGGGMEFSSFNISVVPEVLVGVSFYGMSLGTGSFTKTGSSSPDNGTVDLIGLFVDVKPKVSVNIQFSQDFKVRLYGQYTYGLTKSSIIQFDPDGTNGSTVYVDPKTYSFTTTVNGNAVSDISKIMNWDGLGVGLEAVFRF